MPSLTPCCGTSIGLIVHDAQGRLLEITRGWYPEGQAPIAGHDDHGTTVASLHAEAREETGLTVTSHRIVVEDLWLPNLCASPPARIPGHRWALATATVTGVLAPDPIETRGAAWYTPAEVEAQVQRTLALGRGQISDAEFAASPGLEPVWIELLHAGGIRTATETERTLARRLYTTPPTRYWDAEREVEVPAERVAAILSA